MERLLTVEEVAFNLKYSPWTIRNWIRQGKLPATKVGKEYRINENSMIEMTACPTEPKRLSIDESIRRMHELQAETAKLGPFDFQGILKDMDQQDAAAMDELNGACA